MKKEFEIYYVNPKHMHRRALTRHSHTHKDFTPKEAPPPLPTYHELNQAFADAQTRGALARVRGPPTCTSTSWETTCKHRSTCTAACKYMYKYMQVQTSQGQTHTHEKSHTYNAHGRKKEERRREDLGNEFLNLLVDSRKKEAEREKKKAKRNSHFCTFTQPRRFLRSYPLTRIFRKALGQSAASGLSKLGRSCRRT